MELETRICPSCGRPFRVLKTSPQKYDTRNCIDFKGGKLNRLSLQQMYDAKRCGYKKTVADQV